MKTFKRIVAVMLAVMLIAAMGIVSVSAANQLKFSMNSTDPNLTKGFTYTIYRVAKLSSHDTGAYTFESGVDASVKAAVNKTEDELVAANTTLLAELDKAAEAGKNVGTQIATLAMAADAEDNTTITTDAITDEGIYYARVTGYPDTKTKMSNTVAVWPRYNKTNSTWVYDNAIDLGKKVNSGTENVTKYFTGENASVTEKDLGLGETVSFTLEADVIGSEEQQIDSYVIWDKMCKGLTFAKTSLKVYFDEISDANLVYDAADTSKDKGFFTVADTEFKADNANYIEAKGDAEYVGGTYITVSATEGAYKGTVTDAQKNFYDHSKVFVTYTATLNKDAVVVPSSNPNKDGLIYSRDGQQKPLYGSELRVFTYSVALYKYDGSKTAKTPLAGAEFKLYKKSDTTNAIATGVSDNNGLVTFKPVGAAATDPAIQLNTGDYVITEEKAPAGFVKLTAPIEFKIESNHAADASVYYVNGEDGVLNYPAAIPQTGGAGTLIFTIIGGCLVLLAGAMFIVMMRKRTSK